MKALVKYASVLVLFGLICESTKKDCYKLCLRHPSMDCSTKSLVADPSLKLSGSNIMSTNEFKQNFTYIVLGVGQDQAFKTFV